MENANTHIGTELRIKLMEIGYSQPSAPLKLDNTTAAGILTK